MLFRPHIGEFSSSVVLTQIALKYSDHWPFTEKQAAAWSPATSGKLPVEPKLPPEEHELASLCENRTLP